LAKRKETVVDSQQIIAAPRTFMIEKADLLAFGGNVRLDRFLVQSFPELSRSRIQELISSSGVTVNGKTAKASQNLSDGASVVVDMSQLRLREVTLEPTPLDQPLEIIFEDEHIIVVNKPAGVTVHPGAGTQGETTLVHALLHHCGKLSLVNSDDLDPADVLDDNPEVAADSPGMRDEAALRPGIVHRLDRDTSGCMVVAKTASAHRSLAMQFHDKTNFRQYLVLCSGVMPVESVVRESWLGRDPAHRTRFRSFEEEGSGRKYSKTVFRREATFDFGITMVSARLYTGRTHQIRVHARDLGIPVTGDASYGDDSKLPLQVRALAERQMLHAWKLGFIHPATGERVDFEASLPADFTKLLSDLLQIAQS